MKMPSLVHERCSNHALREAAARCPECGRFYCRECITEHEDRVLCASCLKRLASGSSGRKARLTGLARVAQCVLGILICWTFFYYLGRSLLALPSSFHEGTLWKTGASEAEE